MPRGVKKWKGTESDVREATDSRDRKLIELVVLATAIKLGVYPSATKLRTISAYCYKLAKETPLRDRR